VTTNNHSSKSDWAYLDKKYVWHPYSSVNSDNPVFPVSSANGVRLTLQDGTQLIDGMSSWWCAIHGYNHPVLNQAIENQLKQMSHVMFGGLSHEPASLLAEQLVKLTPEGLESVFFTDSGSVAVEVAMKMAIQYWFSKKQSQKNQFLTIRSGYHGDTFGAMSVSDPVTGMHRLFQDNIKQQVFVEAPNCGFDEACTDSDIAAFEVSINVHAEYLAAVILEPIVQGAGGMRFYSPEYLQRVRALCNEHNVLLIVDEIATGFGRTGKLFACEHAEIEPDIMCVGKALTGGYMTLAATLTTKEIGKTISQGDPGVFMHGPTFMANPLACAVANASITLLLNCDWQFNIKNIEKWLIEGLENCSALSAVADVRVLGAIGVVELYDAVDMRVIQQAFVDKGVWIRPFGKLIYLMPPFIIEKNDLKQLTDSIYSVISENIET